MSHNLGYLVSTVNLTRSTGVFLSITKKPFEVFLSQQMIQLHVEACVRSTK